MNLLTNIVAVLKVVKTISEATPYRKLIDTAREEQNFSLEKKYIYEATHAWASKLVSDFDMHVNVKNEEYLPTDEAVVYVANHQSYLDIVALFHILKGQAGFVAKDAFKKIPSFNKWIVRVRSIFLTRGDARGALESINLGVSYLNDGFSMIIFPEGTRSRGGALHEFKPGSIKLATKAGVKIVPISINGTYKIYEGVGVLTKGQECEIIVHKPIETKNLTREELVALPSKVEDIIVKDVIVDPKYAEIKKLYI